MPRALHPLAMVFRRSRLNIHVKSSAKKQKTKIFFLLILSDKT
jgi:hypothetical protein